MERDEDNREYRVLVNGEEQYSLWLADLSVPTNGWKDTGVKGSKAECLKYVGEVWTDMRPKSLRDHMEAFAKKQAEDRAAGRLPPEPEPVRREPPRVNDLVQRLCEGQHHVSAERYKSAADFKQAIDNGYVLLKFTETKGGTELGVRLDKSQTVLDGVDFEAGTGTVKVCGTLVLNYNEVEFPAEVDISNLQGKGCLRLIADEPTWRAKQLQKEKEAAA